jgi:hypothetical protein
MVFKVSPSRCLPCAINLGVIALTFIAILAYAGPWFILLGAFIAGLIPTIILCTGGISLPALVVENDITPQPSLTEYQKLCAYWDGAADGFAWLIEHSHLVGLSQASIAQDFEFAASTVSSWAKGTSIPASPVQRTVVAHLRVKADLLLSK